MATLKQKKAIEALSENIGKPMGEIMRESGYSESNSKTPKRLTESDGWKELIDENIPDKDLAKVHKEGLGATKRMLMGEEPDYAVRHKYLETGYKIKGKMSDKPSDKPPELHLHLHSEKMIKIKDEYEDKLRKLLEDD